MKGLSRLKGRSRFANLLLVLLLVFVVVDGMVLWHRETRSFWPTFPSDVAQGQKPNPAQSAAIKSLAPEIIVQIDRDYAYRIGDVLPVTLYLKEKAGTQIDLRSMALEGDFEIVGEPIFLEESSINGGRRVRVEIKLQSFSSAALNKPIELNKWTLKANLSYRVLVSGEDVTVNLPALDVYTSNTWDGRNIVEQGKLAFKYGLEPFATAGFLLFGLIGAIYFFRLGRHYNLEQPVPYQFTDLPSRFQLARRDFNVIWAKMRAGDRSADRYAEISQVIRRLYRVETKTTLEAGYYLPYTSYGPIEALEILKACDRVIYRDETLSQKDHWAIKRVFDRLVPRYPRLFLANLPSAKVVRSWSRR